MLLLTSSILYRLPPGGQPTAWFEGAELCCCCTRRRPTTIVADRDGRLVWLAEHECHAFPKPVPEPVSALLGIDAEEPTVLAGTFGAHLYLVTMQGVSRVDAFDQLPCRANWRAPWGGLPSVRSLAAGAEGWVYANVHAGGVMASPDAGASWHPVTPDLHEEVHQIAACPTAPGRLYANTAHGVYVSSDHGQSWEHRANDLGCRYGRAVAVHPSDPDTVLASVSDGPHGENVHGQLFRSTDAGRSWRLVGDPFPASTVTNIDTGQVEFESTGRAWAVVGHTAYASDDAGASFASIWDAPEPILLLSGR